jgi:tyrosinase
MNGGHRARKLVPLSETVGVNTREVNVAIEGVDRTRIAGSFTVHLVKDGERIASRFFFQPSDGKEAAEASGESRFAHFDFLLPIHVVAEGQFSVEIEPLEPIAPGEPPLIERMGHPTLSVYLMLESK